VSYEANPGWMGLLQPGYLPWLGFFEQMLRDEVFVHYDDVQYTKKDWRNRNRIKTPQGPQWLTVPVVTSGRFTQLVAEVRVDNSSNWQRRHLGALEGNYRRAPHFEWCYEPLAACLREPHDLLIDLDDALTRVLCGLLGFERETHRATEYDLTDPDQNGRVIECMKKVGKPVLYNGAASRAIIDLPRFRAEGLDVVFQDYTHPTYPQLWGDFVPYLSVVDLLMNVGPDESLAVIASGG
jgi:hypothetical protein